MGIGMKIIGTKEEKGILRKYPYLCLILLSGGIAMLTSEEIGLRSISRGQTAAEETVQEEKLKAQTELLAEIEKELSLMEDEKEETKDKKAENDDQNAGNTQEEDNSKLNQDLINNTRNEEENTEIPQESEIENEIGKTEYVYYTPLEIESYYYSDAGKTALTTTYHYSTVDETYFQDAAFIGDSRTVGISDYAGLDETDFYCESSMTIFKVLEDTGVTYQKTGKKVDLKEILQTKQYGKIYLMLGINELGYGNTERYYEKYRETVEQIREWQPDAVLYIMANLHISREKSNMDTEFNNVNINDKNAAIAGLADGVHSFYLDCNPVFTDEEGFLKSELTFDGVHLYAQHYDMWKQFLMEHAVEKAAEEAGK